MDIFALNLKYFAVVIIYLFRDAIAKLTTKIKQECVIGTKIISIGVSASFNNR